MQDSDKEQKIRLDKWLWHGRFFKTRSLAAKVVSAGHVRINSNRVTKPAHAVRIDDVLTFAQAKEIRVVRVQALGTRRGPASEAQTLFEDLSPIPERRDEPIQPQSPKYEGKGRPTKRDRRILDHKRSTLLD